MATWWGNDNDNRHKGNQQNQYGLGGDDTLITTKKGRSYSLYGGEGDDQLVGYNRSDSIYGGSGADNLYGYGGNDYLDGGKGSDYLGGFYGNDVLVGGDGRDAFFFETRLNRKENVDRILDFSPGEDRMRLSKDIFDGLGKKGHTLKASKFEVGTDPTSGNTRILYDDKKGVVYYTPKGDQGNGKEVPFAKVSKGIQLDHDDFFVIS